jgi:hypothetical protein
MSGRGVQALPSAGLSIDFAARRTYKPVHPITISSGWRIFAVALLFCIRFRLE